MTNITPSALFTAAGLAAAGWWVSHVLTVRRDRDKFRREALAREIGVLLDITADISEMTIEYHTNQRNLSSERRILIAFDRLSHRAINLPFTKHEDDLKKTITDQIIELKIAVTGEHFESDHQAPLPGDAEQLALCQLEAAQLESRALNARQSCYVPQGVILINYWTGRP